jgi:hypothetical protein
MLLFIAGDSCVIEWRNVQLNNQSESKLFYLVSNCPVMIGECAICQLYNNENMSHFHDIMKSILYSTL